MNVTITGSRYYLNDNNDIHTVLNSQLHVITHINVGDAVGVDAEAIRWAEHNKVPYTKFDADWPRYGKAAGFIRNKEMLQVSRGCIAIWDSHSAGTEHCIQTALSMDNIILVKVFKVLAPWRDLREPRIPCKKL